MREYYINGYIKEIGGKRWPFGAVQVYVAMYMFLSVCVCGGGGGGASICIRFFESRKGLKCFVFALFLWIRRTSQHVLLW